jgi:hypothetical protein
VLCREDALLLLQRPLSQQLELLHLWHAALSTYLETFLQQFREAGGRVMLAAGMSYQVATHSTSSAVGFTKRCTLALPFTLHIDAAENGRSTAWGQLHTVRGFSTALMMVGSAIAVCGAAAPGTFDLAPTSVLLHAVPLLWCADKETFSIAVEDLSYEGPMRLQVPQPPPPPPPPHISNINTGLMFDIERLEPSVSWKGICISTASQTAAMSLPSHVSNSPHSSGLLRNSGKNTSCVSQALNDVIVVNKDTWAMWRAR